MELNQQEIEILSPLEGIRNNPGMYIGSVQEEGIQQLFFELVQNALDEVELGHAQKIWVKRGKNFFTVQDDGRGIPTEIHPTEGISLCELVLTRLHTGSKFKRQPRVFTSGIFGVGLSCVNALSEKLQVTIKRRGKRFSQIFERGKAVTPLMELGSDLNSSEDVLTPGSSGTAITCWPDPSIFLTKKNIKASFMQDYLQILAFLRPQVEFTFFDEETGQTNQLSSFVSSSTENKPQASLNYFLKDRETFFTHSPVLSYTDAHLEFFACMNWTSAITAEWHSYINAIPTPQGGTHEESIRLGVTQAVNQWIQEVQKQDVTLDIADVTSGLVILLECRLTHPQFSGAAKNRLTNTEIETQIVETTRKQLGIFLRQNTQEAALWISHLVSFKQWQDSRWTWKQRALLQISRDNIDEKIYQAQFGERSVNWHQSATWITHDQLLEQHAELCEVGSEALALDVCCGSGVVGSAFRSRVHKVIGLDLTPEMIQLARSRLEEVYQGNIYQLPFIEEKFDLVCTREVLHLLPRPEKPVAEIWRVLKPGGQFIVGQILPYSEVDAPWMFRIFKKKQPLLFNMFQESDFRNLLLRAGFIDIKMIEMQVEEPIDVWINSVETTLIHRHEIRQLYYHAPEEVKKIHPFRIDERGQIFDQWRWCIFSARKPSPSHH